MDVIMTIIETQKEKHEEDTEKCQPFIDIVTNMEFERMTNPLELGENKKSYKFGEIYCTFDGLMTIHCNYCPSKVKDFGEFSVHYMVHFDDVFVIKKEEETLFEPSVYIEEKGSEVKVNIEEVNISSFHFEDTTQPPECKRKTNPKREHHKVQSNREPSNKPTGSSVSSVAKLRTKSVGSKLSKPTERPKLTCRTCNQQFVNKTTMEKHVRSHEFGFLQTAYECDICQRQIKSKKDLLDHMRKKHAERKYACKLCNKKFKNPAYVAVHMRVHIVDPTKSQLFDEPQPCHICGKEFVSKVNYARHIKSHAFGFLPPVYDCDICGDKISNKKDLSDHMRLHAQPKYECKLCGKKFKRKSYMEIHYRIHNNVHPFICAVCGKTFVVAGALSWHMRRHDNTMPQFPCNICGKVFTRPGVLADHLRIHSGQKPFGPCEVCGIYFRTKKYLTEHRKSHLNEGIKFACDLCGAQFKNQAGVRRHQKLVHLMVPMTTSSTQKFDPV
ncbi:Zinc finger protein [Pseudolycoriella hygida]|uniref:Zinc finger protein 865 n=1 Tax=Pseudolycoriella hygida TaxID=35572 RepID=A0A9Q0S9L9_9DIPT|nr:Zinc finger protein [Pseudolycoriella hygida]